MDLKTPFFRSKEANDEDLITPSSRRLGAEDEDSVMRLSTRTDVGEMHGDIIIVLDADTPMHLKRRKSTKVSEYIVQQLDKAGLQYEVHNRRSKTQKLMYISVNASEERLRREAKRIKYVLPLEPNAIKSLMEVGYNIKIPSRVVTVLKDQSERPGKLASTWEPYEYLFHGFDDSHGTENLFVDPFAETANRAQVIMSILKASKHDGGAGIRVDAFLLRGRLLAVFQPHNRADLTPLMLKWGFKIKGVDDDIEIVQAFWNWPFKSPIQEMQHYFGSKVGMYFMFLSHYTTKLFPLSIVGTITWIAYKGTNRAELNLFFSLVTIVWAAIYLESLKNEQSIWAKKWGTASSNSGEEVERPEFQGKHIKSFVDGKRRKYMPAHRRVRRFMFSGLVVALMVLLVIAANGAIFYFRMWITVKQNVYIGGFAIGSLLAAIASAIQVQLMGQLYGTIVEWLNNYENHRTDADFQSYFIVKTFFFHFINTYSSLFYIAFIEEAIGDPCGRYGSDNCLHLLEIQLATLFLTAIFIGNFFEVALPYCTKKVKERAEVYQRHQNSLAAADAQAAEEPPRQTDIEKEFLELEEYDMLIGLNEDYREMVLQFGFCTLFSPALPMLPALAYANNFFELKVDAFKVCINSRRPTPERADGIGAWFDILDLMSTAAIVTNVALVVFVSGLFTSLNGKQKLITFVLAYHFLFAVKAVLGMIIDDVPEKVQVQLAREAFITERVFGRPDGDMDLEDSSDGEL